MTYQEAIDYLYTARPAFHLVGGAAYKPGLENVLQLMQAFSNPHLQFQTVHVAGTNGKGSTSHLLAAVLQAAGYKTGLYTSPHLVDFRERIRINGEMVSEQYVTQFIAANRALFDELQPSFFETTTALAFSYFAAEKVDIAVIETGLGGRLDATNIITPEVAVITNIGYDHTEYLGTTLQQIAAEKAGIIKPKRPVVIGEHQRETDAVFIEKAAAVSAPLFFAEDWQKWDAPSPLDGVYQKKNRRTASVAIDQLRARGWHISEEAFVTGYADVLALTGLRGRWEKHRINGIEVILDTGHNSHGISTFAEQLWNIARTGTLRIVIGMVADKDVVEVFDLLPKRARYYFCEAQTKRAIPAHELQQLAERFGLQGSPYPTVAEAVKQAMFDSEEGETIFIGGSNYVVGEALPLIDAW